MEATQRLSTHVNMKRIHTCKHFFLFRLDLSDFDFIWAGLSNVDGYTRNTWYNLSCLLQTAVFVRRYKDTNQTVALIFFSLHMRQ